MDGQTDGEGNNNPLAKIWPKGKNYYFFFNFLIKIFFLKIIIMVFFTL